jgi:SP family galactose:H+ symporter-like MFS transporter
MLAGLGGLLFGYDTGIIGGAQLFIRDDFHLSSWELGVVVSSVLVGAILGAAYAGHLSDQRGRRYALVVSGVLFLVGSILQGIAPNAWFLVVARVVDGLGIGVVSMAAPVYVAEMAPPERRGSLVSLYQLAITIGIFAAYLVNLALTPWEAWRWMLASGVVPAIVFVYGLRGLPSTPRWLLMRGDEAQARESLHFLGRDADAEVGEIRDALAAERGGTWRDLFRPAIRPALMVGIGLAIVQQITGINTVIYYAPTIFKLAGFESDSTAIWASVSVSIVNVLSTIIAVRFIDRVGRRPLLIVGLVGMAVSLAALATGFLSSASGGALGVIAIVSLMGYVCFFAFSLGPIVWVMISEIFPLKMRASASSVSTSVNWAANLLVAVTFVSLLESFGESQTFYLYAAIGLLSVLFVLRYVPETKGKTLEQIQGVWAERAGASEPVG